VSGKLVNEVLENAPDDLTAAQMLVLVALAEDARERGPYARQARFESSADDVVRRTRLKPGTVRNVLAQLVHRGLIVPLNGRARPGIVQHYRLTELYPHHRQATTAGDFLDDETERPA